MSSNFFFGFYFMFYSFLFFFNNNNNNHNHNILLAKKFSKTLSKTLIFCVFCCVWGREKYLHLIEHGKREKEKHIGGEKKGRRRRRWSLFRFESMPLYDGLSRFWNHVLPVFCFRGSRTVFTWKKTNADVFVIWAQNFSLGNTLTC